MILTGAETCNLCDGQAAAGRVTQREGQIEGGRRRLEESRRGRDRLREAAGGWESHAEGGTD